MEKERDRVQLSRTQHPAPDSEVNQFMVDTPPLQRREPSMGDDTPDQFANGAVQLKASADATTLPPMQRKQRPSGKELASETSQLKTRSGAEGLSKENRMDGMPSDVLQKMESSMSADFSAVQFKENSSEATQAGALAFARGNEVHFAPGQFMPNTPKGQELIGHELAHVVQQRQGRVQATGLVGDMAVNDDQGLEAEADRMGAMAANAKAGFGDANPNSNSGAGSAKTTQMKLDPKIFSQTRNSKDDPEKDLEKGQEKPEASLEKAWSLTKGFDQAEKENNKEGSPEEKAVPDNDNKKPTEANDLTSEDSNDSRFSGFDLMPYERQELAGSPGEEEGLEKEDEAGDPSLAHEEDGTLDDANQGNEDSPSGDESLDLKGTETEASDEISETGEETASDDKSEAEGESDGKADADVKTKGKAEGDPNAQKGGKSGPKSKGGAQGSSANYGSFSFGGSRLNTAVPRPDIGNLGEGKEPELTLVSQDALSDYDPKMVVKDNGDGTYLVVSSIVPAAEPPKVEPIQMVPDPGGPDEPKKPVPQSDSKEAMSSNREKAEKYVQQFDTDATAKISSLEKTKTGISTKVGDGANEARNLVIASAESERSRVELGFESEKANLLAGSERVRNEVLGKLESSLAAVKLAADTAREVVEKEFEKVDGDFVTLDTTQKESFTASFQKAKQDLIEVGEKYAKQVIAFGDEKAKEYGAEPIPSMSTAEEVLNGPSYEKDRHDAKVKGAKDAAAGYAKGFRDEAKKQSESLNQGEKELHQYVTESVKTSREGIKQRKDAALTEIEEQEKYANRILKEQSDATCQKIELATEQSVKSLEEQKVHSLGMIDSTAEGKLRAIEEAAVDSILNLEYQIQGAIDGLHAQKNQIVASVSKQNNPSAETVNRHLKSAMKGINAAISETQASIDQGCKGMVASFDQMAQDTVIELGSAADTAIETAAQTVNTAISGLEKERDGFIETANILETQTTDGICDSQTKAATDINDQYKAVKDDFDKAKEKLDAKMAENARGFDSNVLTKFNEAKTDIPKKAQEAKDAVQPRWVRWLLVAIEILVVILITAVLLAAMASGVGILGLLLIGAVAGAIGGAIKYGAKVALTSEKFSGAALGKAMLDGAFDGVNIAVSLIPGVGIGAMVGMGALGGAFKYGTEVIFTPGAEFSWTKLVEKTILGGVTGLFSFGLGKLGNGLGGAIASKFGSVTTKVLGENVIKRVTAWTIQSFGGWLTGAGSALVDNWINTGVWDMSKFTDALTLEALVTNAATTVIGDVGTNQVGKIKSSTTGGDGSTPTTDNTTPTTDNTTPTTDNTTPTTDNTNTPVQDGSNTTNENTPVQDGSNTTNENTPVQDGSNTTNENTPVQDGSNTTNENTPVQDGSNTTNENTPVQDGSNTTNENTTSPQPKMTGKEQAAAKGYPDPPPGYEWVAGKDGEPYVRRTSGGSAERVQVRFDADSGTFKPVVDAPQGYHWELVNGQFQPVRNANMTDTLPVIEYDPQTGGFKDSATGQPFSGDVTDLTVRGQDYQGFQDSLHPSDLAKLNSNPTATKQAFELFAAKDWAGLEALFNAQGIKWPPNRGFISVSEGTLDVGAKFDRFGGYIDKDGAFQDKGTFVAPYGADFEGRALPDSTKASPLKGYEVLKPIKMKEGPAIPWFGKKGGGTQWELPMSINDLIAGGYIREIPPPVL